MVRTGIPKIYLSAHQTYASDLAIFLRGTLDPGVAAEQLRQQVQSVNPELPVFGAQTLKDARSDALSERRFSAFRGITVSVRPASGSSPPPAAGRVAL